MWLGVVGNSFPFFAITWALQYVSSGVSGLLMGTIPILILGLAHFFLPGERLNRYKIAGVILGFTGLAVLLDPRRFGEFSFSGGALLGQVVVMIGCLSYAVHSITAKRLGFGKPLAQSFGVLFCGAITSILFALVKAPDGLSGVTAPALWASVGLGLFPTGIATIMMYRLMDRTSPTMVAQSNYLVPVYAVVFGALTLGESLNWNIALALALILAGIFVSRLSVGVRPA
jgi:drug/metabolite transporter (DMT)-like permease